MIVTATVTSTGGDTATATTGIIGSTGGTTVTTATVTTTIDTGTATIIGASNGTPALVGRTLTRRLRYWLASARRGSAVGLSARRESTAGPLSIKSLVDSSKDPWKTPSETVAAAIPVYEQYLRAKMQRSVRLSRRKETAYRPLPGQQSLLRACRSTVIDAPDGQRRSEVRTVISRDYVELFAVRAEFVGFGELPGVTHATLGH